MATIRQDNIIVSLKFQGDQAQQKVKAVRDEVVGIQDDADELAAKMIEAFETDVIEDYIKVLQEAGIELEDIEEATDGIRNRLRTTFDTSDPDKYAQSLARVSQALSDGRLNQNNFVDSLKDFQTETDKTDKKTSSFFRNIGPKAKSGLAVAGTAIAAGAAAIAATVVGIFAGVGVAIGTIFSRAVDRVPEVRREFERLQNLLSRVGDYIAAQLAPIFNRLIGLAIDFIEALDLTKVLDVFNSFFITLELITEELLALFGLDFENFGEGIAGVVNVALDALTQFFRFSAGFRAGLFQLFGQIRVFLLDFAAGVLGALDTILPGGQFDEAILNLRRNSEILKNELLPGIGQAFQAGLNEFDRRLEDARANYDDFDLFRGFDNDAKELDKTLAAAVGSIAFYQEQIAALRRDADRVAPDVAAILLDTADSLELSLGRAEARIQQNLDRIRGILVNPIDEGIDIQILSQQEIEESARRYADDLIAAAKAVANQDIAPQLIQIADDINRRLEQNEIVLVPSVKSTLEEVQREYEDTLDVIERLDKVYQANAARRQKDIEAQRDQLLERLDGISEIISGIDQAFGSVADAFSAGIDQQIDKLDDLVAAQESRVEAALVLAERGNAEILQLEEQRLDALLAAREDAVNRERSLAAAQIAINQGLAAAQGIVAVTRAFAEGNVVGGIAASIALTGALAGIIISLTDAFSSIPTFFKGIENVPGEPRKLHLIGVHGGERVLNNNQNREIPANVSNRRIPKLVRKGLQMEEMMSQRLISSDTPLIDNDSISYMGQYDFDRLESLMITQNAEIARFNKNLAKLKPNIIIPPGGIHKANKQVQRLKNFRKALLS